MGRRGVHRSLLLLQLVAVAEPGVGAVAVVVVGAAAVVVVAVVGTGRESKANDRCFVDWRRLLTRRRMVGSKAT